MHIGAPPSSYCSFLLSTFIKTKVNKIHKKKIQKQISIQKIKEKNFVNAQISSSLFCWNIDLKTSSLIPIKGANNLIDRFSYSFLFCFTEILNNSAAHKFCHCFGTGISTTSFSIWNMIKMLTGLNKSLQVHRSYK